MAYNPLSAAIIAESAGDVTVVNTVTETDLITLALPTTLAAGDVVRFEFIGDALNNSLGAINFTFKLYLGATLLLNSSAASATQSSSRRRWGFTGSLYVVTTASEEVWASCDLTGPSATQTTMLTAAALAVRGWNPNATEDLTSAKTLKVTATMGTADPLAEVKNSYAYAARFKS